jgi:hypothetical protein
VRRAAGWFVFACVMARLAVAWFGQVTVPLDAWSFREAAASLRPGGLVAYNGARPPMFPLLLLATGGSEHGLWLVQSVIGLGVALALFFVVAREARSPRAAALAGASVGFGFYALAVEAQVMSECLLAGVLAASLVVAQRVLERPARASVFALLGALAGVAVLTRPMFLFLPVVYVVALRRAGWRNVASLVATSGGIVLAWSTFNWATVGYFGPTTLLGFNLTNHCGAVMEHARPEFAPIRDVYLKYRAARIELYADHMQTIWDALPEMMRVTGLPYAALSKRCLAMCLGLIVDHPGHYAASVARALGRFMLAPNYRAMPWLPPGRWLARVWDAQEAVFIGSKAAFVLVCPLAFRKDAPRFAKLLVGVVLAGAVFQALLELGENDRYSVPLQPWAACAAVLLVQRWWAQRTAVAAREVPLTPRRA